MRAAVPCESTHMGWPEWKAEFMRLCDATPVCVWQSRQKRSVLWHDWQSALLLNTSTAWRSTKLAPWKARESAAE
jgi:hypothetical protein